MALSGQDIIGQAKTGTGKTLGFGVPILIENTAGGDHAMARTLEAIDRLWDAVGDFDQAGFCLDTCHAWAGGEDLVDLVERVRAITGRIVIEAELARDGRTPDQSTLEEMDRLWDAAKVAEKPAE